MEYSIASPSATLSNVRLTRCFRVASKLSQVVFRTSLREYASPYCRLDGNVRRILEIRLQQPCCPPRSTVLFLVLREERQTYHGWKSAWASQGTTHINASYSVRPECGIERPFHDDVSWIVTRPGHAVVRLQISNTNTDVTTCSSEVLTILAASPSRPRTEGSLRLSPRTLYAQLGFTKRVLDAQKSSRRVFRCTQPFVTVLDVTYGPDGGNIVPGRCRLVRVVVHREGR